MEVISIERSTYEELLTSFNNFVTKMKEMASRGNDKRLGDWLDNQDVCQMLNIHGGQERCVNWKNQKWTFHSFVFILSLLCHHKRFVFRIYETCKFLGKKASERLWSRRVGAGATALHSKLKI